MNERDLLDAVGAVSDATIEKTVLSDAVSSAEATGLPDIEMIMTKPAAPEKRQAAPAVAEITQKQQKNRIHHIPAAAVVAACLLLNVGVFLGVYSMRGGDETVSPADSAVSQNVQEIQDEQESDDLYVEVQENSVSPIACTLILHNDTDETVSYAESFHIYDKTGKEVNRQTFSANAYVIEPGKTGKLNCLYGSYAVFLNRDDITASGPVAGIDYDENKVPLAPGEYEIQVGFITSSEYIQYRRTTLTITDEYEDKRPLEFGMEGVELDVMINTLKQNGFTNFEVIAEPTKTEQYLSAGQVQRTEPHGKYVDLPYEYETNPPHTMINPEDFIWVDKDETIKVYVSTGSHDPDIVKLPVFTGWDKWDHELAEQFLTSAGLDVYVQYLEGGYNSVCPEGCIIRSDPASTDSEVAELRRGDIVVLYVNGSEEKYGHSEEQTPADTETIPVPDFTGMAVQTAKKIAEEAGIHLSITLKDSYEPYGTVIRQGMAPGDTRIGKGDYLELEISNGKG